MNAQVQKRVYAHRGASAIFPENTLESFRRGLNDGANALELDVRCTKDDQVVVFHDEDGVRLCQKNRRIRECTLDEVLQWDVSAGLRKDPVARHFLGRAYRMPLLEEVLEAFPNTFLNVDIKDSSLRSASLVVDLLRRKKAQPYVLLTSFHIMTIRRLQSLRYEGALGLSRAEIAALYLLPAQMLKPFKLQGRAAQVPLKVGPFRLDTAAFVQKCHDQGLRLDYWVVNERRIAQGLWRLGADGVMSDNPGEVISGFPPA